MFGMILFPNGDLNIHLWVIELVSQYKEGKSYAPALLAKQIRSLNHLKKKGRGKFKSNLGLLTVWFISHLADYGNQMVSEAIVCEQ